MSKSRKIFLSIFFFLLILGGFFGVNHFYSESFFYKQLEWKTIGTFQKTLLSSAKLTTKKNLWTSFLSKNYLPAGYYDMTCESGEFKDADGVTLSPGTKVVNQYFYYGNLFQLEGKGKLKITPSTFEPLSFVQNKAVLKNTVGWWKIGEEIPDGFYNITIKGGGKSFLFLVQQVKDNGDIHESKNLYHTGEKIKRYELKKGNTLQLLFILKEEKETFEVELESVK